MANKDRQEWYKKFYEGTFFVKGWKARMNEILRGLPPGERGNMSNLLEDLGKKIAMEWARENDVRKIDTFQLQKWGRDLQNARREGPKALADQIRRLNDEVEKMLA